eukprot:6471230-Amphidinium_carterae.2
MAEKGAQQREREAYALTAKRVHCKYPQLAVRLRCGSSLPRPTRLRWGRIRPPMKSRDWNQACSGCGAFPW